MDYNNILKKVPQEQTSSPATKEKRARSPPGSGDEMSTPKKIKLLDYLQDISPANNTLSPAVSLTSPESCEKRTDESSESPSTPMRRYRVRENRTSGATGHANTVLDLQRILHRNYKMLKEKMEPIELADKFYERGILDQKGIENIHKGNDRRIKNDILIKELCSNQENAGYFMFISFLKETGQGSIVTELENSHSKTQAPDLFLNERHDLQTFVVEMKETLLEEIEPRLFIDEIVVIGGISLKEHEAISTRPKRRQRIQDLLEKVKSANSNIAAKIIKQMTDAYPNIYKAFKDDMTGIRSRQEKRPVRHRHLVPAGSPLEMCFRIAAGNNVAVQDTNEHADPVSEMRKKRQEVEQIESRIVNNLNENPDQLAHLLDNCIADLKKVKFSSIKIYLKALSKESLGKLVIYSRSGAAKKLLLSLIDEETKRKLLDLNAKVVLEINKGCNDNDVTATFENECMCHLNKESVTCNFTALMEGMRGSRNIIRRFLQSHIIDDKTFAHLKEIQAVQKVEERNEKLLQFLLLKDLPDVFFCILEEEIVKHGGSAIIRATIKDYPDYPYTLTKADIRMNQELLVEELETRWFIRRLEKKKDKVTEELLETILASESRDQRTGPFVEYLLRQNDLSWFSEELKIRNKHLYDALVSNKVSRKTGDFGSLDFGRIQTATHLFFDDIIEEVDPLILTKRLGEKAKQELHISKLKSIPERSKRASRFCLSLLGVSQSTFYEALNKMAACGYQDIVENITDLAREGPLNGRYMCPKVTCLEQCNDKYVCKETFTLDENSTEDAILPSTSEERNTESVCHIIIDDTDNSDTEDDCTIVKSEVNQFQSKTVDKSRDDDCFISSPTQIKLSRKSRVQSLKGGSESGIFSGSGICTEGINTDDDSDYEDRSSAVDKRRMITEWIASQSKSESVGILPQPVYTTLSHKKETRSILHEDKGNVKQKQTEDFIAPLEHTREMYL